MSNNKSWAERHPVIFGALVGSVVPGIGTLAGALGGVVYSMTESNSEQVDKNKQQQEKGTDEKH